MDRLVEAIDEDGDSLIDLIELQTIIGGQEIEDSDTEGDEQKPALEFNENVLAKIMESNEIDNSQREEFLAFAQDYNDDDNSYLKKEELQAAADGWNARQLEEEEEQDAEETPSVSPTDEGQVIIVDQTAESIEDEEFPGRNI